MGVTRTSSTERSGRARAGTDAWNLPSTTIALIGVTMFAVTGLALVYFAKTQEFSTIERSLAERRVLDLSTVGSPGQIEPFLAPFTASADRRFAAARIYRHLTDAGAHAPRARNVGTLAQIRVDRGAIEATPGLSLFQQRLGDNTSATDASPTLLLLTPVHFSALKPSFIVRRPSSFRRMFLINVALFLAAFPLVHLLWRLRRVRVDPALPAAAHLLTSIGLITMVSLRDPLRDLPIFAGFAQGVALGCVVMVLFSTFEYQRGALRRLSFVPLLASVVLSVVLIMFGTGPGTSDAKVNLLGVQPVEAIRILLILFLAGYFANRWEFIRELHEEPPQGSVLLKHLRMPRLDHVLPVALGVTLALLLFFFQKDLGPALVFSCVFLILYAVSRRAMPLMLGALLVMGAAFWTGYQLDYPHTVASRIDMWRAPWENEARGGDQIAHSLWAFASGAVSGTGVGLGDPAAVPAAHTDMVLGAVGEEFGFAGVFCIAVLYVLLIARGLAIARRAPGDYSFFLALGLTVSTALQVLLIAAGVVGLVPLSGVVTPFLSFGKSSMIANFAILGILCAIGTAGTERASPSSSPDDDAARQRAGAFAMPLRGLTWTLAALAALVMGRIVYVQVLRADATLSTSSLALQGDGTYRYQDNPRLRRMVSLIPRGTIYDRQGLPLATSRWDELEQQRAQYRALGINLDSACSRDDERHYPLGDLTFHLIGDSRTRTNWGAPNTSFEERDSDRRLRGFDDHARVVERTGRGTGRKIRIVRRDLRELVPLWRYRYRPKHRDVRRILDRSRDLRLTIDARLQARVSRALGDYIRQNSRVRGGASWDEGGGAAVVMDASSGELLASVSNPDPVLPRSLGGLASDVPDSVLSDVPGLLDRARYGLYPPGSTFKLVTAIAALRKDPALERAVFACTRLPDGRVGRAIPGWGRPIRDDVTDTVPHGNVDMERGVVHSCNAYFAQLGISTGAGSLLETARLFDISIAQPETADHVRANLPQTSYGQAQVLATPFKMARVAAAIAAGGVMPFGRWVIDANDRRNRPPVTVAKAAIATRIGSFMRGVVTHGTARSLSDVVPTMAGKTGTAEVQNGASHAWFVGYAPYGAASRRIAFAVIVEHGGYGGRSATPVAAQIVAAARELGYIGSRQ